MNDTTLETKICLASAATYDHPMLLPVMVFILMASALSILFGAALLFLLLRHPASFHWNTRLLLVNLSAALVLMSIGSIGLHSLYLVRTGQNMPSCPFYEKFSTCAVFEYIRVESVICVQLSLVSIALERALATWKYKTYEGTKNPVLVFIAIAFQWSTPLALFLRPRSTNLEWVPFCNSLVFATGLTFLPTLLVLLVSHSLAGAVYLRVLTVNKRLKRRTTLINQVLHSLSIRYQLSENIRSTRMMLPSLLAHVLCFVPLLLGITPVIIWHGGNLDLDPYHVQISHLLLTTASGIPCIYGMCHPIICILQTPKFCEIMRKIFIKNTITPMGENQQKCDRENNGHQRNLAEDAMDAEAENHFRMLALMWKSQN